jgi:tetratricopeptide (TPR) repeat protein
MQLELRQPAKKLAVVAALFFLAASYLALTASAFLAAHFSTDPDAARLKRAVWLDPGNAEYRYRVGRYELLAGQSPQAAIPWLEAATALNPHSAKYWLDLAIARQSIGDTLSERPALERALAADPRTPDVAWQAANLYLAQGSLDDAMREFRVVMENDPALAPQAISLSWKLRPDIESLLSGVIPPNVYDSFLGFLISRNETAAAAKVWDKIFSARQPIERPELFTYMRYLIAHQEVSQATTVWQQAATLSGLAAYQPSSENLLINGDFSMEVLNGGFDWLHQNTFGVALALDPNDAHSSSRSLRITFDGPGISDAGIRQLVPVEPNTSYEFSAFYKAQAMDGAGGPKFAIQDLYRETKFFMSDDLRDSDFWRKADGTFTTGPDTHLLVLRIARVPAGSPIRGKLWIDGLQLTPIDSSVSSAGKETLAQ